MRVGRKSIGVVESGAPRSRRGVALARGRGSRRGCQSKRERDLGSPGLIRDPIFLVSDL